nr:hypothetical protein [Tanacetum cinerariifolium]
RSNWASSKRTSNSSVLCLMVLSSSVTLSLTPSKVVGAISIILSTIASHPSGAPVSVGLVVRGDGKGNGGDGIGSGGESKAACLAMDTSIDADMGGSSLTVFRALRRRV